VCLNNLKVEIHDVSDVWGAETGSKKVVAALVARAACQMVQVSAKDAVVEYVRNLIGGASA